MISRRFLQLALAALWLLDGALQCQSFMFSKAFGRTALAPTGDGQAAVIRVPVHWAASVVVTHPALINAVFAGFQLLLGIALLWRRTVRLALLGSVGWGLSIWWLGEGLGGTFSGETLLTGAPGAALLYAIVALLAWPAHRLDGGSAAPPPRWALLAWASMWAIGIATQLTSGNDTGAMQRTMLRDMASDAPGWIARFDNWLAGRTISSGYVAALVAIELLILIWALIPGRARTISIAAGILLCLAAWLVVQGLGDLTTGQATDPNTGPLLVLIGLAAYAAGRDQPARRLTFGTSDHPSMLTGSPTRTS